MDCNADEYDPGTVIYYDTIILSLFFSVILEEKYLNSELGTTCGVAKAETKM